MTPTDLTDEILKEIASGPAWFPQAFDPASDRVLMVHRKEEDYRAASFLDQRSLSPDVQRQILSWTQMASAVPADARKDSHYIFHIGHVGSTLISRLLGEEPEFLCLREPLLIRAFAEVSAEIRAARIEALQKLLSRTFRPHQRALIKATSYTSEIAPELVTPGCRVLFLYARPQAYIEGILAGDASRQELQVLAPSRRARLARRCPDLTLPQSEAMLAAEAWACEMTSLEKAAASFPGGDVMWLDFDRFLEDPARHLLALSEYFGRPMAPSRAEEICAGPLMRRYSKALEYEYSPQLRQEVLAEARGVHGPAIEQALGWLRQGSEHCPLLAQAIERAS